MDIGPSCSHYLHPYELIPEIVAAVSMCYAPYEPPKKNPVNDVTAPSSSCNPDSSELNSIPNEEASISSLQPEPSEMKIVPNEEASISSLQPEPSEMKTVPVEETLNFSFPPDSEMNPVAEVSISSSHPDSSEMNPGNDVTAPSSSFNPDSSELNSVPNQPVNMLSASFENFQSWSEADPLSVGFIGLGSIGRKILKKFFDAHIPLYVYDRHMKEVKTTRITKCHNPADVIQNCNITFYCEPEIKYAELVIFGRPNGVVEGFEVYNSKKTPSSKDKGFVMLETISSELSMRINETIHAVNGLYVEAPMIGSLEMAHYSLLKIIAVGDRSLFHECEKHFKIFAMETKFLEEPIGRALDLKVIHSMIEGTMNEALKEVFTMAPKVDVANSTMLNMLGNSPLNDPILMAKADALVHDEPENTDTIKALQRDMALVVNAIDDRNDLEANANSDHSRPFSAHIAEMYRQTLVNSLLESDSADRSASLLIRATQHLRMNTERKSMKRKK